MLAKDFRLDRQSFWLTKQTGKSFRTTFFSGYSLSNNLPHSRYAVILSTNLLKKAVDRNRWRRKIYNLLKIVNCKLKIDLILYPRPEMLKLNHEELRVALAELVSKTA